MGYHKDGAGKIRTSDSSRPISTKKLRLLFVSNKQDTLKDFCWNFPTKLLPQGGAYIIILDFQYYNPYWCVSNEGNVYKITENGFKKLRFFNRYISNMKLVNLKYFLHITEQGRPDSN